jgi:hypothetical protein
MNETLHSEAGFTLRISGRKQSKEGVFLFDEYTYKQTNIAFRKVDD